MGQNMKKNISAIAFLFLLLIVSEYSDQLDIYEYWWFLWDEHIPLLWLMQFKTLSFLISYNIHVKA